MLESDRVRFENMSITDYDKLPALLDEFAERLVEIGPNPYKGLLRSTGWEAGEALASSRPMALREPWDVEVTLDNGQFCRR